MIANRATTSADNKPLISGGQVYIKATRNGQEVFARKYGIGFKQASTSSQPMGLYYGNTANADSVVVWGQADSAVGSFAPKTTTDTTHDTSGGSTWYFNSMYIFDSCTNFGWINCDHFMSSGGTLTNVTCSVPDNSYNWSTTQVYVVIPSINSVMSAYSASSSSAAFMASNIPIGTAIRVVAIAKKGNDYYYAEHSGLTVTANMTADLSFSSKSLSDIKALLTGL